MRGALHSGKQHQQHPKTVAVTRQNDLLLIYNDESLYRIDCSSDKV